MTTPKDFTVSSSCCTRFYESDYLKLEKYDEDMEIWCIQFGEEGEPEHINYCPFCGSKIR